MNDIGEMFWKKNEPDSFAVIHEDDSVKTYIYTKIKTRCSHLYPVLSDKNQFLYFISEDKKGLMLRTGMTVPNVREFRTFVPLLPQYIYEYLEKNAGEYKDEVECLIIQSTLKWGDRILLLDANRLRSIFPNLNTVLCPDDVKIENTDIGIRVIDPFELGEKGIERKLKGDTDGAYRCIKLAEHLDSECGAFYWNAVEEDAKSSKESK